MEGYINKKDRKKLLFIGDDARFASGIANVSRDIISFTAHHYNIVQIAGAINHPDKGKKINLCAAVNEYAGTEDAEVYQYPTDGYGNPQYLRDIIKEENPDAIVFITDPRYYIWLFNMEHEIRTGKINGKRIPMIYVQIWDEYPIPTWNYSFYRSVDLSLCISKQTVLINKLCLGEDADQVLIDYFPHGINPEIYKPTSVEDKFLEFKSNFFKHHKIENPEFILFFNSRNIRRKSIPDTLMAFYAFLKKLPEEKAKRCYIVLHTQKVDDNGTDLVAVTQYIFKDLSSQVKIDETVLPSEAMNYLYNIADATVLLSSNEGFGLSGAESIMTGTPVIGNVTGGVQDYARFEDENGNWFTPNEKIWSNHKGTYKKCGEWFFPVFPSNISIQGSPATPFIFDSRVDFNDAADQIMNLYNLSPDERKQRGLKGREWLLGDESNMSVKNMAKLFIRNVDAVLEDDYQRPEYEIINCEENKQIRTHELPEYIFKK